METGSLNSCYVVMKIFWTVIENIMASNQNILAGNKNILAGNKKYYNLAVKILREKVTTMDHYIY